MKGPRVLALYRSASAPGPSAATDTLILAAAQRQQRRASLARPLLVASAVVLACVFILRWVTPGAPEPRMSGFGIAEGQVSAYLATFDPYTPIGPGSQEGLP